MVFTCIIWVSLGYACWKMMDVRWSISPRRARLSHPSQPTWRWPRRGPPIQRRNHVTRDSRQWWFIPTRFCMPTHGGGFIKRVSISLCSFQGRTPSRLSCIQPQQLIPHLSGPFSPSLSQTLQGEGRRSDAGGLESAKQAVRSGPPNLFLFFDPRVCSRFFCDLWRAEDFSGSFPSFVGWSRCLPRFSRQLSLRWPDRPDAPGVPGTKCSTYCAFCHSSVGFSSASEVLRSILMKIHLQKNSYLFLISLWKKRKILTRV